VVKNRQLMLSYCWVLLVAQRVDVLTQTGPCVRSLVENRSLG